MICSSDHIECFFPITFTNISISRYCCKTSHSDCHIVFYKTDYFPCPCTSSKLRRSTLTPPKATYGTPEWLSKRLQTTGPPANRFRHDSDSLVTPRCLAMQSSSATSSVLRTLAARSGALYANSFRGPLSPVCLSGPHTLEHCSCRRLDSSYCKRRSATLCNPGRYVLQEDIVISTYSMVSAVSVGVEAPSSSTATNLPSIGQQQQSLLVS